MLRLLVFQIHPKQKMILEMVRFLVKYNLSLNLNA